MIILLILCSVVVGTFGQSELLPKPGECGSLSEEYMYNQKYVAEPDEFPWMAKISYSKDPLRRPYNRCLAVLITKQYLLSYVDCFDDFYDAHGVVLGDWSTYKEPDCTEDHECEQIPGYVAIEEVIQHRNYRPHSDRYRIVLIRLVKPVTYSKYIRPICMPHADVVNMAFVAQHLQAAGQHKGRMEKGKSFAQVMSSKECRKAFEGEGEPFLSDIFETNQLMCAFTCRETEEGLKIYWSGSALMGATLVDTQPTSYYLIGLIAYVGSLCNKAYPHIIFRVDSHLNWITENIY